MRILYVYDGNWPKGATRVVKQTRSLLRAGHTVHLLARNEQREARRTLEGDLIVHRLPAFGPTWLNRVVNFPYFFNPVWVAEIYRIARESSADCLVVADLPLAPTVVWVARRLGLPVHYDMAEVYPEFLRGLWEFDEMAWTDHLVRNPRAAEALELWVLRRVNTAIVVSEESRLRCRSLGVPADRLVLAGNTPENPESLSYDGAPPADMLPFQGRPIILFVGILIGDRGVGTAIEAMKHVSREVPDALLVVVGDGPDRERLESMVAELGLHDHVALLGWKDHATLPQYYSQAQVGLLPFLDGRHVRITLANKLFDYMGAGLAIVASDLPPMRRILEECDSGSLVPADDPEALGVAVARLVGDPVEMRRQGENGQMAVLSRYRWSEDEKRLLEAIERGAVSSPRSSASSASN